MDWWGFASWGAFGGFVAAGLDFVGVVSRVGASPWSRRLRPPVHRSAYLAAAAVRMVIGSGLAAAAGTSGYITNSLLALSVGVSAPIVVGKLTVVARAAVRAIAAGLGDPPLPRGGQGENAGGESVSKTADEDLA